MDKGRKQNQNTKQYPTNQPNPRLTKSKSLKFIFGYWYYFAREFGAQGKLVRYAEPKVYVPRAPYVRAHKPKIAFTFYFST